MGHRFWRHRSSMGHRQSQPARSRELAAGLSAELFDGRVVPALYACGAPAFLCGVEQINFLVATYATPVCTSSFLGL